VLLVIFGAGASYDSVPQFPLPRGVQPRGANEKEHDRPPLANHLFDNRPQFVKAMRQFPDCMALVPQLRRPGISVEKELARFQEQAETFPQALRELAAIRYYLHVALWDCQDRWLEHHQGITNYATLVREIERWRVRSNERVCFVTFNYDTMLEHAMTQVLHFGAFGSLEHYVSHDRYTVVKLHGSVNWGREVDGYAVPLSPVTFTPFRGQMSCQELIANAAKLLITDRYRLVSRRPMLKEGDQYVFPALSIPVENKDEFSCPRVHIDKLEELLPSVTKIITIGWRATEADFLHLLKRRIPTGQDLMIVSGDARGAEETDENFTRVVPLNNPDTLRKAQGFTGLISTLGDLETFLRRSRKSLA
jgi:hypothetical protein